MEGGVSSLGDRIKVNYEDRARHYLTRRMPVIVRVDGRAFHSWTRGLPKPFSRHLMRVMVLAARDLADDMQGFKACYIQSDEASFLLTDYDDLTTEAWFDYCKSKVESISAAVMTARFNLHWGDGDKPAVFDGRAFNVPKEEVSNYFLWRAKDWERNSLSMYCRAHFSAKQLHGKRRDDQHEMLHSIGKNWTTDLTAQERNGTFLLRINGSVTECHDIPPSFAAIDGALAGLISPILPFTSPISGPIGENPGSGIPEGEIGAGMAGIGGVG